MKYVPLFAIFLLAGCVGTPPGDAIRAAVISRGPDIADRTLENAEWLMCRATSVGSVLRRYGVSEDRAAAWRTICAREPAADIIKPD